MKLSQKHFALFKAECKKNLERMGLHGWRVYYEFKRLNDSFGRCQWKFEGRVATITLANDFPKPFSSLEEQIKETALHECIELLLSPISDLATSRGFCQAEFDREVHAIIRTLEKLL